MRNVKNPSVLTEMTLFDQKIGHSKEFTVNTSRINASIYGDFGTKGKVELQVKLPVSNSESQWFTLPDYTWSQNTHTVLPLHLNDTYRLAITGCKSVNINLDTAI